MATVGSLVVRIGADVSGLSKGLQSAQGAWRGFGGSLKSMGSSLSLGVTAPIVGIATAALTSAAGFEQSMNLIQATTGATGSQMEALQQQALDSGATTSFSAGEAAAAMLELSKAGMTVEQTTAAIPGVMDLAAAGGIELASAATITANAINSFGLEASAATGVANTFAAAANASSADVEDLAAGFQMAGAVFAANGQSVDSLATSLAILANNGIAGSDAGTSLKTMMMRLAAPTTEASAAMAALGLNVYDAQGAMLPFGTIIGQLETATAGLSDEQRNSALATIFGADAIRAATILANEGAAGYTAMQTAVGQQGAAAVMANANMKGLGGAIEYFKGTIDSVLIGAASPFMEMLSGWVRGAADLIVQFSTLSPETQKWAVVIGLAAAAAGPLLMVVGAIATGLAALLSPIGLVVAAVGLLGVAWATNFGGIQEKTTAAIGAVTPVLQTLWTTLQNVATAVMTFLGPAIERVQGAFGSLAPQAAAMGPVMQTVIDAFSGLWTAVQPILAGLGGAIMVIVDFGINLLAAAIENLSAIAAPIFLAISTLVSGLATIISETVTLIGAVIAGDWATVWQSAQDIMAAFGAAVLGVFNNLVTLITTIVTTIASAVTDTLTDMGVDVDAIITGIQTTWSTIFGTLAGYVQPAIDAVGSVVDALQGAWDWLRDHVFTNPFAGWDFNPFNNGGDAGNNAVGTPSWRGGATWVGEFGPELVQLPAGARIWSHDESMAMAGASGGPQVVIQNVNISQGLDWEELRWRLNELTRRRG